MSGEAVGAALYEALRGPEPSVSARELVDAAGGTGQVARAIVGLPATGKLPGKSTPERKAYNAAIRRVQRWVTTGAEARPRGFERLPADVRARAVRAAWDLQFRRNVDKLRANGARARFTSATVKVSSPGKKKNRGPDDVRVRSMPAGGPGVMLDTRAVGRFTTPLLDGELEVAGDVFLVEFFEAYGGFDAADPDVEDPGELTIWPEGEAEPS